MNGGGTKPESYCKITAYVQHNAPTLYDNIQDLCLFGAFNAHGKSGVTLLLPDQKTQDEIDAQVGKDARKAVAMINACILPVYMESIGAFREQKDDIPNKLGNRLPIAEVTSSAVKLTNGSTITRDGKFKRLYEDSNIAVFNLSGLVPTTGDASSNLGKKGRKSNGYVGGDDDFKERGRGKVDGENFIGMLCILEAQCIAYAEGGMQGVDPLTHHTMGYLNFLEKKDKSLYDLLTLVHPISPLYFLFAGDVNDTYRKEWVAHSMEMYDKKKTLLKQTAVVHGHVDKVNIAKSKIKNLTPTTINGALKECISAAYPGLKKNSAFRGTGSIEEWVLSMQEFCYLFTVPYINAIANKNIGEISHIFSIFKSHVLNAYSYGARALLCNEDLGEMDLFAKERFCTLLSFYTSNGFCPGGADIQALQDIGDGDSNGVRYGWNMRPNIISRTSYFNKVANFWNLDYLADK